MTKKDYKLIADVLLNTEGLDERTHARLVQDFVDAFKRDNPRFDADKFRIASGME